MENTEFDINLIERETIYEEYSITLLNSDICSNINPKKSFKLLQKNNFNTHNDNNDY